MSDEEAIESPAEPKVISKINFVGLVFVVMFLLIFAELAIALAIGRSMGLRNSGSWIATLGCVNMTISTFLVDCILKRYGLSLSGKTLEIQGRTTPFAEPDGEEVESVEIRVKPSHFISLGVMLGLFCLFTAPILILSLWKEPPKVSILQAGFGVGILVCGTVSLSCFHRAWWGKPTTWADASGIHFGRRFVPWSRVATCEIVTHYDTFGKPERIIPTLKGPGGDGLMTIYLGLARIEDQERLVKYIKTKLPKPQGDFWE